MSWQYSVQSITKYSNITETSNIVAILTEFCNITQFDNDYDYYSIP